MTNKTLCFLIILLGIFTSNAQITSIPDTQFEQALIDQGIDTDGNLNGQVLTSNITNITSLTINGYDISNFEGLQDFNNLTEFLLLNNYSISSYEIDFSGNLSLTTVDIVFSPNLNNVIINQNNELIHLQVSTTGTLFSSIDVTHNPKLRDLILFDNKSLTTVNIVNNLKIEYLNLNSSPIAQLDVSNLNLLSTLAITNNQLENLDLSLNNNLITLLADGGTLQSINLKNDSNNLISYLDLRNNPNLSCIMVDDAAYSESANDWYKDITAAYIEELIINDAQDKIVQYDGEGNQDDLDNWLALNGEADANDCLEPIWSYAFDASVDTKTFPDGKIDDIRIVYEFDFFATDVFGNQHITAAKFIITNARHFSGPFYGTGNTVCENSKNLNDIITKENGDFAASLNNSDITNLSFEQIEGPEGIDGETSTFSGTDVDFPDTPAGSYTYRFKTTIDKEVPFYDPQNPSNDVITIKDETDITINDKTFPLETQEILCPDTNISSIQDLSDLLVFNNLPEGHSFNPNQYWTPSIFTGSGTYTFDPSDEFEGCSAVPISVVILEPLTAQQNPEPLSIEYNPDGNNVEINAWLNNNGGGIVSGTNVTWSYKLDSYRIAYPSELICSILFTATDICGNKEVFSVDIYILGFPLLGETDISNDVICGESFNLDGFNGTNLDSSTYDNSDIEVSGPGTINGIDIDFPDSGAGSFSYQYMVTVSTDINIGGTNINITDSTSWTLDPVIVPFNPGEDKTYTVCQGSNVTLKDLYDQFEIIDGTDAPFNSDEYWFNSNGDKITAYSGPGDYVFNAEAFLPQCGGIPATVTVIEQPQLSAGENGTLEIKSGETLTEQMLFGALTSNPDTGGTWFPALLGAGIYTYTHQATSVCMEVSTTVEVTESTLSSSQYSLNEIELYPNPTHGLILLNGNTSSIDEIKIFSISGRLLLSKKNQLNSIDLSSMPSGVYFIHVKNSTKFKSFKVIKK